MDGPDTVSFFFAQYHPVGICGVGGGHLDVLKVPKETAFATCTIHIHDLRLQVFCEGENWNSSVPTCLVPPATPQLDLPELVLYHLVHNCSDDVDGGNSICCL